MQTEKKKVDSRIRAVIQNCVKNRHRALFVVVGDHGKDQVVNLHYILARSQLKNKRSVLWCYKKDLGFSTHRKKRIKQVKKQIETGIYNSQSDDPFELFISSNRIRWCYYKDTMNILGNTYGTVVLQDFEALTPNLLARVIETVEGGGMVVLLLRALSSLKQLYTMTMDVHSRFRTEAYNDVVPRFNERFLLSLGDAGNCLVVDDRLNILPISKYSKSVCERDDMKLNKKHFDDLTKLKNSFCGVEPTGSLIEGCKTVDQAKALLGFIEAISDKQLRTTISLTASRGRGKSAALGFAISAAIAHGYSNIFITSPTPENLKTVFEFIFKGFDAIKLKEHVDYEVVQSTNVQFNDAVVRVNIFRHHKQTIQYIDPSDSARLSQAELLVIDEAAAIPLPIVKNLLGNYLIFISSTINGYEGTGRSLSLKLLSQLRKHQHLCTGENGNKSARGRVLREISISKPIRYDQNDPIEGWLDSVLCLNSSILTYRITSGIPHPSKCNLFHVNRDALFSYHRVSEAFLQRMMSLYAASHYKNSPNDLQLMCDAPAHELFVLLGPHSSKSNGLPDVLCAIQVCKEGNISKDSAKNSLARGKSAPGDLIPWIVTQQFMDTKFATLSGARIVRVATHPDVTGMGYGTRAINLITDYYGGKIACLVPPDKVNDVASTETAANCGLLDETIKPRKNMPPLLTALDQRRPEKLHYIGVSYGVTASLFKFWSRLKFLPVYLRQVSNMLTGEHSCIMIHQLSDDVHYCEVNSGWIHNLTCDFAKRFTCLLGSSFRHVKTELALNIISTSAPSIACSIDSIQPRQIQFFLSLQDIQRLGAYSKNMVDFRLITDLLPAIAKLYFFGHLGGGVRLSALQCALLVGLGMQNKQLDGISTELQVPTTQLLAMLNKCVRKVVSRLAYLQNDVVSTEASTNSVIDFNGKDNTLFFDRTSKHGVRKHRAGDNVTIKKRKTVSTNYKEYALNSRVKQTKFTLPSRASEEF
jgi:N-acetyltransferase 10